MTDEIQTNEVPIQDHGTQAPNPAEKTTPGSERSSIDDALNKAFEEQGVKPDIDDPTPKPKEPKAEAKEKTEPKAKAEPKEQESPSRERAEDGKFKPREPKDPETEEPSEPKSEDVGAEQDGEDKTRSSEGRNIDTPPARFLPRAKEKWGTVDPDVRGEVYRALDTMQKGLDESEGDRQFRKELKDFEAMAAQHGTTVRGALENYTRIDQQLRNDPAAGVESILRSIGLTPQQYAQFVLGQAQQQQQNPQAAQTQQLQQQIAHLTQTVQQLTQGSQREREAARVAEVERMVIEPFKASHPRYDELEADIVFFLNSDKIPSTLNEHQRLETAYDMAERINPAPSFAKGPLNTAQAAPLTQAGNKSVSGSPSSGIPTSKPKKKGEHVSIDDALERAFQKVS